MSAPSGQPAISASRAALRALVPWLCSSSGHLLLLVGVIAVYERARDEIPVGRAGHNMEAMFIVGGGAPDSGLLDASRSESSDNKPDDGDNKTSLVGAFVGPDPESDNAQDQTLESLVSSAPPTEVPGVERPKGETDEPAAGGRSSRVSVLSDPATASQSRGSAGLPHGYTRTGVFGVTGEGRKFVYVFDRSGSMDGHGGTPLAAAKAELIASLKDLDDTHQFQIIFYNERPRVFSPTGSPGRLVFGTEQNKRLAEKFVGSITADGGTQHEEALAMALKMAPDVIFFLTDADEPRMKPEQLARMARLNQGTQLYTIEFGYGVQVERDNFLVKLARQNGGQHVYFDVARLKKRNGS
jgi:hypothetical protein